MKEKISFFECTCGRSWKVIGHDTNEKTCPSCGRKIPAMFSYDLNSEEFAKNFISANKKISDLEELCERAYHTIDESFEKLCDEDGYGPMTLISDLEKVKNGKAYKGITIYIKALTSALTQCEKNKKNK